jgi:hypothetical protein
MMLLEFVNKYAGKKIDYDKKFGCQCVDLFRQYCQDVWQIPHTGGVEGASDLWNKYEKLPGEKTYLKKTQRPEYGSAVVFGSNDTNKYGHVAIVIRSTSPGNLLVFEQDGFNQEAGAHLAEWDYGRVLGYLQKKRGNDEVQKKACSN